MEYKRAYLFITHHPDQLLLYKSFITIIKKYHQSDPLFLIKVNHPYYKSFNFTPYRRYFDRIIEFPFLYQRNVFQGIAEMPLFKKNLVYTKSRLGSYKSIEIFLHHSAWLPVNILINEISQWKNVCHLYRCMMVNSDSLSFQRYDIRRTLFYKLYALLGAWFGLKQYPVKAVKSQKGREFIGFLYTRDIPGTPVKTINPLKEKRVSSPKRKVEIILPYPLIAKSHSLKVKKDRVIVFGDTRILGFPEYLTSQGEARKKLTAFFKKFENYYASYKLYYKPHPMDTTGKAMPGIDLAHYYVLDNTKNAQEILDSWHQQIRAVYTFYSTSAIWGSFFGIPSYTLYRYVYNTFGIARLDNLFSQQGIASKLIFSLSNPSQIGIIDEVKIPVQYINLEHLDKRYKNLFHIGRYKVRYDKKS